MGFLIDAITWLFMLAGGFFVLAGGIGVLRLPDFYTRLHGASVTDTLGAGLLLIGLMFQAGFSIVTTKLLLILLFMLFTGPAAVHALAKAALHGELKPLLDDVPEEEPPSNT
jgi:multicomponent Na+:H+ antiporter subunit G